MYDNIKPSTRSTINCFALDTWLELKQGRGQRNKEAAMRNQKQPSLRTRPKWVLTGRPRSEEEIRAARAAGDPDPATPKRFDIPSTRNVGGIA